MSSFTSQAAAHIAGRAEAAIYSDVCEDTDTGDEDGVRITILRFAGGDFLALQYVEGAARMPALAPASFDRAGRFSADVADGDRHFKLHGSVTPAKMVVSIAWASNRGA